jgi:hypothetical protein
VWFSSAALLITIRAKWSLTTTVRSLKAHKEVYEAHKIMLHIICILRARHKSVWKSSSKIRTSSCTSSFNINLMHQIKKTS